MELLGSGVSIKGMSINDVIYKDFKNYVINDNKFGIGQVFTTNFKDYINDLDKYREELDTIANNNGYKLVCLFVTDIISNDSYLLYNTSASGYLVDAYNLNEIKEGIVLKGIISRKKQMVPPIMEVLEKA